MVIVIADKDGKALRELSDYTLEVAFGEDENTITITADADVMPPNGGYAYIDGTEYGGTIDKIKSGTANNTLSGSGRSWHGVLAGKRIVPASGQSHVVASGQVSTVLQQIIDMIGLSELFEAPSAESDQVTISNYQFERFVDAYSGLRALCLAYGLKLTMRFSSNKVFLGARAVVDYGSKVDSDLLDFDITVASRCTNHLICGGTGENENRAIIHFYADAEGNVSHTQTFFGVDEIVGFYDYSNASEEQLEENGKKKLEELQTEGEVQVSVHDDLDIDVGDIVTGRDNRTGMIVSAPITKKIVKVSRGVATYSYEAGTASSGTSASTISGSAESTNGGHAYYAGNGLTLDNYTFNADVDAADLQAVNETASNALTQASSALSNASAAQDTADAAVATINASSPINASRDGNAVSLGHTASGVSAGAYGAASNTTADWGDIVNVGPRVSINATGHITDAQGRTVTLPGNTASRDTKGLMSATDKAKLDGIAQGANKTVVDTALSSTSTNPVQNKAVKAALDDKSDSDHTHNYAGSSSPGGAATSANKLATARTITLTGAVNGQAVFDGSEDITITTTGDSAAAGFLAAHPVGAIYHTTISDNPSTVYGGIWQALPSVEGFMWERTA